MKVHFQSIYKLHGISALPVMVPEIELVAFPAPTLTALLTINPEPHFTDIDRSRAIVNQLLKGLFTARASGDFNERLSTETALVEESRAKRSGYGVFVVLKGETDIAVADFKARRDIDDFGISIDDISQDEIRELFRQPIQAVLMAIALSLPVGSDLEFEKFGELVYCLDEGSAKPIYVLNTKMGTPRVTLAHPLTVEIVGNAVALATRFNTEQSSRRVFSLLRTSLDRATDDLQGFITAWSALEMFVIGVFKSKYKDRWFAIMAEGAPKSAKPIFERFEDVMSDKYRLADKFLVIASVLDAAAAQADATEFRRLKKIRDELLHVLDVPPGSLPREAVQRLLVKFMKLHFDVGAI